MAYSFIQDKDDDILVAVKSTALRFGEDTKKWLAGFSGVTTAGLALTGMMCDQTWPYYSAVTLVSLHLARQISTLDIENAEDCAEKFVSNRRIGLVLFLGIVLGTYFKNPKNSSSDMLALSSSIAATLN